MVAARLGMNGRPLAHLTLVTRVFFRYLGGQRHGRDGLKTDFLQKEYSQRAVGQPTPAPPWGIGEAEIERENLSLLLQPRQSGPPRWKL